MERTRKTAAAPGTVREARGGRKGYFYPLVKAVLGNDSAATKSNSITFGTTTTTLTIFACEDGTWRDTHEAATEAEALAWLKGQFGAGAGGSSPGGPGEDSGDA